MVALTMGTGNGLVATVPGAVPGGGTGASGGGLEQAVSVPRIAGASRRRRMWDMWVLFLEALGAVVLLVLIVWWTMFHGRRRGERDRDI
jgi:hypothetical protein